MGFFDRLSTGWKLSMNSFKVLKENKKLIIFPILSGISLLLIMSSFIVAILAAAGWDTDNIKEQSRITDYLYLFGFYVVNYFVIVFFNMALIYCTKLYFSGEEVTIKKGIQFSLSRIGTIFSWAIFAGTIGTILKIIQENVGSLGKIITGIIGIVWSIATFFVVPIIAFENAGPIEALNRSRKLMAEKWGESIGASFSFGIIHLIAFVLVALPLFGIGMLINPLVGIALGVMGIFLIYSVLSAAQTIFISAVYLNINDEPTKYFDKQMIDNLFVQK